MKYFKPIIVSAVVLLAAGCASHSPKQEKEKPILERGWIGGRYDRAKSGGRTMAEMLFGVEHTVFCFPRALTNSQTAGVLTVALATNTPAFLGGIREGDLILELNGRKVTNLPDFRGIVTSTRPGAAMVIKIYRDGKTAERDITVGREKYREGGYFTVGIPGFLEPPHLIPTSEAPWFSLVALGYEKNTDAPLEFNSVKERYVHSCNSKGKQGGYDEEWKMWFPLMWASKGKRILAQEPVMANQAAQSP